MNGGVPLRIEIMNVGFDNLTMDEAVEAVLDIRRGYVVTPNPEIVWMARKDTALRKALDAADLVVADGIGVIYAAKILGKPLKAKIPGSDLALQVLAKLAERGGRVFLFGSKPGVAEKAGEKLLETYPGLIICGTNDGYFSDSTSIVTKINAAQPDVILVCLGAPKQELWMHEHLQELNGGVMMGLGGTLDVLAGNVKRAPESWQKHGLEWLYRLIRQPTRIKRMIKLPAFLMAIVFQRLKGGHNG